eukprot:1125263_1
MADSKERLPVLNSEEALVAQGLTELAVSGKSCPTTPANRHCHEQERESGEWIDVTQTVRECVNSLEVGEMIHGEHFSLYDAMSALELMEPKMDVGLDTSQLLTIEEALETGLVPTEELSLEELAATMDYLTCCEVAFYEGGTLGNTIFTCLY